MDSCHKSSYLVWRDYRQTGVHLVCALYGYSGSSCLAQGVCFVAVALLLRRGENACASRIQATNADHRWPNRRGWKKI